MTAIRCFHDFNSVILEHKKAPNSLDYKRLKDLLSFTEEEGFDKQLLLFKAFYTARVFVLVLLGFLGFILCLLFVALVLEGQDLSKAA
ncbi:hypothetical protein Tco_0911261, partial [Tanacetum coccineum]